MVTIEIKEHGPAIRIQNDRTFGDIMIYPRDFDEERQLVIELTKEILKNED